MKKNFFAGFILFLSCSIFIISCGSNDNEIQSEVNNKLSNRTGITASIKGGVVVLNGTCPDQDCKTNAEQSVKGVKGVKSVTNNITIVSVQDTAPVDIASDETLKSSVNNVIENYKGVQADVKNGVIMLRGQITRDDLQKLLISLNELKPQKIENQLVIK